MPTNVDTAAAKAGGQSPQQTAATPDANAGAAGGAGAAAGAGAGGEQPPVSVLPTPTWWSFLLIGIAMALILFATGKISTWIATNSGKNLTNEFRLADPSPEKKEGATASNSAASNSSASNSSASNSSASNSSASNSAASNTNAAHRECKIGTDATLQNFILKQRAQLVVLGDGNLDTAIQFGAYFYANIVILAVFGLMSLISLLVITKTGLKDANGNVVAIFLLATGVGLIYQGFFGVFQQRRNVEANMAQSISYGQLVKQIDTYCITGKVAITNPEGNLVAIAKSAAPVTASVVNPVTPITEVKQPVKTTPPVEQGLKPPPFYVALETVDFILYIDWKMRDLQKLSISFDDKAVSTFTDSSRLTGL